MRAIAVADIHVRASNPQFRIDNYPDMILWKVEFIVDTANWYKAKICIAGDIFDNVLVGYRYTNRLIQILRKAKYGIYTVPGQHDQEHHGQDMTPTPYQTLIESGVIIDVNGKCVDGIYGLGWECEFSDVRKGTNPGILIIHYCVTDGVPPFFLEGNAKSSEEILQKYDMFSHIVCGDYHIPHINSSEKRLCINCGSIGRSNKDQMEHKPRIVLFDTKRPGKYKKIFIPIKSSDEVFNVPEEVEVDEKFSEQIKELAEELANKEERPNFVNTVKYIMQKSKAPLRQNKIAQKFLRMGRT
jgi:DNA repair exonuclease SbcCD nuclease subunit